MKKIIVALLAITLLASFAFADGPTSTSNTVNHSETHTIQLRTFVTNVDPDIQLVYTSSSPNVSSTTSAATDTAATGADKTSVGTVEENGDVDIGFSISKGGKVVVSAVLKKESNTFRSYTLRFGGGEFTDIVRRGQVDGNRAPEKIVTQIGTVITATTADKGISSITYASGSSGDNRPIVVNFDGKLDVHTYPQVLTTGLVLATAEYEYLEDKTIDSGTYFATVFLEVVPT